MSLSNTTNRVAYTGNGSTTAFAVSFPFNLQSDLLVIETTIATGAQTTKTLGVDYTISGTTDAYGFYSSGGTVNATVAPANTVTWTIIRSPAPTQLVSLTDNNPLPVKPSIEQPLDKLTMLVLRLSELVARSFKWTDGFAGGVGSQVVPVANRALKFDGSLNLITSSYDPDQQATLATTSASAAATSATNAASSATAAASSASAAATSATNAASSATAAASSASAAATSATNAANYAAALLATSTTSITIGTGSQTFTTQSGKQFAAGEFILIVSAANSANYMHGQVTSYGGTSLVVNVLDIGGSGAHTDWNISISGSQGATGATGATGPQGPSGTFPTVAAGGTVDAITAAFSPAITLVDQQLCAVVCSGPNTSATPTFSPNGLTAHTITAYGGKALVAGNIGQAGYVALLEYNAANTRWELLNPVPAITWASVIGSRAKDTVYQNTSGKVLLAAVAVQCTGANVGKILLGSANPPTLVLGYMTAEGVTYFPVPSGWYYEVATSAGTITIDTWCEG